MENMESNATHWWYLLNHQQYGPVSADAIVSLLRHRLLNAQTMVSSDNGKNWQMLRNTPLWENFNVTGHEMVSLPPDPGVKPLDADFEKRINGYYFHYWLWTIIGLPLLLVLVGLIPLIVATIFGCFIVYYAWKSVPNHSIGVAPILAVILLFIPVVDCFWYFWAYYFMSREMNQALAQKDDSYRIDESIVFIFCVLECIASILIYIPLIPTLIIGLVVLIASSIVGIFALRSIKDGILALYQYEKQTLM